MIYKNELYKYKVIIILLFIMFINGLCFVKVAYSSENESKILILYDAYKKYGEEKNILNDINKLAISIGKKVDIIRIQDYKNDNLLAYDGIFVIHNKENSLNKNIKENLYNYNKKIFWFGKKVIPELINNSNIIYTSDFNFDTYQEIYDKVYKTFRGKVSLSNNIYFYLDDVTPFIDLNLLVEEINYLKRFGIPFFIQVTPVFENENLYAMSRFSEVLRYAQSSGGEVILALPPLTNLYISGEELTKKIEEGFENYIDYWVYPIGFAIKEHWLYRNDLKGLLENGNTLFLQCDDEIGVLDFNRYSIGSYENIIEKVELNDNKYLERDNNKGLYNNKAIKVCSKSSIDDFKKNVDYLKNKNIEFKSTYNINSKINIKNIELVSNRRGVFLYGKNVKQTRFIDNEEYENIVSPTKDTYRKANNIDLTKSNHIIVIITFVVVIIFVIIVAVSIRLDRNKFFK